MLPRDGVAIVSTDVHGNDADMARIEEIFAGEPGAHWVILGDIVHAPNADARRERPELYDFDDGAMRIVDRLERLITAHPGRIHFVLGNHDHAHVGGPPTGKFYPDEAAALERTLTSSDRERLHRFLERALLAVVAPCGVLLTHGAPDASLEDPRALDGIPLAVSAMSTAERAILRALLTSYGQPDAVAAAMLAEVSRAMGFPVRVVVHGHDRDESGFFREGRHQVCPCIFGAARDKKSYVRLELSKPYDDAFALRDGFEIRRLYGEP